MSTSKRRPSSDSGLWRTRTGRTPTRARASTIWRAGARGFSVPSAALVASPTVWPASTLTSRASGVARPSMTNSRPSPVSVTHTSTAVRIRPPSPLTETKLTMAAKSGKAAEVRTVSLTGNDSDATRASGAPAGTQRRKASARAKAITAANVDSASSRQRRCQATSATR